MASAPNGGLALEEARTAELTVVVPGLDTLARDVHRCSASTTTSTPRGGSDTEACFSDAGDTPPSVTGGDC